MKFWDDEFYSRKLIFKYLGVMALVSVLMMLTRGIAFVIIVPISIMALLRRDALTLFYCVLLSTVSLVTNHFFVPKSLIYVVTQRGLMAALGALLLLQLFGQRQSSYLKPLLGLLVYVFYMVAVSQAGYAPIISNLKLLLYFMTFIAYYSASTAVANHAVQVKRLRSMMLTLSIVFLLGSVLVLPFPRIGMMIPKDAEEAAQLVSLFKGMTNHSQELGPVVTFLGLFLMADLFFTIQKRNTLYVLLLLTVPVLVYKTSSRTAMAGLLAGMLYLGYCMMISRGVRRSWKGKVISNMMLGAALASMLAFVSPHIREGITKFVLKYGGDNEQVSREEVFKTREGKWNEALAGWRENPYFGNGFQVSYQMKGFKANSIADILTAPVEKSTWIYAILEEGGVCGMVLFAIFVLTALVTMMHLRAYIGATLFVTLLTLNLGEFTMFAMSGSGGFMWAMVMTGLVMDSVRNKQRRLSNANIARYR